jgi:uncharacterized membrane protein
MILAVVGIIIASYLGYIYYYDAHEVCDINQTFECTTVHESDYAQLFGISVALIGIAGYVAILLALFYMEWSVKWLALFGALFSMRLTWAEIFVIEKYCIFCLISQAIILAIFFVSVNWKKLIK